MFTNCADVDGCQGWSAAEFIEGKAGDPLHPVSTHPFKGWAHARLPSGEDGVWGRAPFCGGSGGMPISPDRVWDRVPYV